MPALRFFSLLAICLLYAGCATVHESADTAYGEKDVAAPAEMKADSHADPEKGLTPLIRAARDDRTEKIAMLTEQGADTEVKDGQGKTAIMHAFERGNFNSFKLLLEKGAVFNAEAISAEDRTAKKRFVQLLAEYRLYQNIIRTGEKTGVSDFDAFFSLFPKGYYATAVEAVFEATVQKDFSTIGDPPSPDMLRAFVEKYADMGKHSYLTTADSLNIRSGSSVSARHVGTCQRGERVHALEENADWIRTDRGWISREHIRQVPVNIAKLRTYLDKAAEMSLSGSQPSPMIPQKTVLVPKKSRVPQQEKGMKKAVSAEEKKISETGKPRTSAFSAVRTELDAILNNPQLKTLENFIRKYRDKDLYRSLVDSARETYRNMLLDQ